MDRFKQYLCERLGAVSMCWDPTPTGTFLAEKVMEYADQIVLAHETHIKQEQEYAKNEARMEFEIHDIRFLANGETVRSLYTNSEHTSFAVKFDNGKLLTFDAYGDCCSTSWFEHFEGVQNIIGAMITDVEEIPMDIVENTEQDPEDLTERTIKSYGWKFKTTKGMAQLEMRNESNGYYGGNIECGDFDPDQMNLLISDF